jgi:hypothetical protein
MFDDTSMNYYIAMAMIKHGGSFVKKFAEAYLAADHHNKLLLKPVLDKYKRDYFEWAREMRIEDEK